ncbi:lytic polysaccharide monooxygenase [Dothidotthia symphoricarpi CBS 119687]|uniref:AA9 family lytic polysaccharide monooxygenase n=1 Tax=Dothidotthia symphoricarpi CBS 119687 TaxID=1392245 RepID=A0A6A6AGX7_9PLEO|nr:lytic polysaccharide monooxygenase [Dothidotthia symphoricarpi CBS 119687]KAF2131242.1 lytic polysaccharide monooxygenase [Dothidotthia symphoricarpi CBS 119687]
MPTCIAPGDYLMRVELLALHSASKQGEAQFYRECAQILRNMKNRSGEIHKEDPTPEGCDNLIRHSRLPSTQSLENISLAFDISLDDFYFLHPQVDDKCSNLWLETSCCVRLIGNVATYSGFPTPTPGTVYPQPSPTPTSAPPLIVTDHLWSTAAGTLNDSWNPSFSADNCVSQEGKSYCILRCDGR